jgi:hypothetical protein
MFGAVDHAYGLNLMRPAVSTGRMVLISFV